MYDFQGWVKVLCSGEERQSKDTEDLWAFHDRRGCAGRFLPYHIADEGISAASTHDRNGK